MLGIYITAGYPNKETTVKALQVLDELGVDLIELGVPFSDPLADGPVIQKASHEALKQGINLDVIFDIVYQSRQNKLAAKHNTHNQQNQCSIIRKGLDNLILFSYYNPLYAYGFEKLCQKCNEHGISGVLIPDLPVDEAGELSKLLKKYNLTLTLLAAVTSTDERLKRIAELSEPFVYLVSRTGITGSQGDVNNEVLRNIIAKLKTHTNKPIGVGFGIDSAVKVKETLALGADMAIVGTKAVKLLEEDKSDNLNLFREFISSLI